LIKKATSDMCIVFEINVGIGSGKSCGSYVFHTTVFRSSFVKNGCSLLGSFQEHQVCARVDFHHKLFENSKKSTVNDFDKNRSKKHTIED
jgi:hypothetical protein